MTEVALAELNREKPSLPSELLQFSLDEIDILDFPRQLEELWNEILAELSDIRWSTHNIATYNRGCHGPLCKKAVRQDGRRKRATDDTSADRTFKRLDPIIEFYAVIARLRLRDHREARLMAIKAG
jgi:hypothetical protein